LDAPIQRIASSRDADLLLVLSTSLTVVPLALLADGWLRVAFAVPFIIFSPGYALVAALYPRADSLDGIERLALSFGTSIAVVPLLGLGLNYTPWGIRLIPVLLSVMVFVLAACIIARVRRTRLLPNERFGLTIVRPHVGWREMRPLDRALSVALVASIVFAVGVLVYAIAVPRQGEEFTEFYILGTSGMAEGYPTTIRTGQGADLILGLVNHEGEPLSYRVEARLDGNPVAVRLSTQATGAARAADNAIAVTDVGDEQEWEETITLIPLVAGEDQKLELLLFTPKPRVGYYLRALLGEDGYASIELDEVKGRADVTLNAGDTSSHDCRIEAWQNGQMTTQSAVSVPAGEETQVTLRYPAGQTQFRLYDGDTLVLDDSGAALSLHLWVDVTG
jgi:uncharacterized membrane protein